VKTRRIVAAFILAPLAVPLVFAGAESARHRFATLGPPAIPSGAVIYLWFVVPTAYAVALLLGGPALYVLRQQGWTGSWSFALTGGLIGFFVGLALCSTDLIGEGQGFLLLTSAAAGALSSLSFRWVANERT
jgi:hypothetical protein